MKVTYSAVYLRNCLVRVRSQELFQELHLKMNLKPNIVLLVVQQRLMKSLIKHRHYGCFN